jgi:uncharacterized membrane protein YhaH (DUF805 family)
MGDTGDTSVVTWIDVYDSEEKIVLDCLHFLYFSYILIDMNQQDRINAMISYFFLGPLFLFVPVTSPLGVTFVRMHARRASGIM